MSEKTTNFINTIGVLARNEFLSRDRFPSNSMEVKQHERYTATADKET